MEFLNDVFTSPPFFGFVGGLIVGLIFLVMAWMSHLRTKKELKRFQRHLAEKLEIEGEHMTSTKEELARLKQENENLRMKIGNNQLHDSSAALERELELFARAEKTMVMNAPGFAPAWESASSMNTPGSTGKAGKWSARYSSARATFLSAVSWTPGSQAVI